MFSAASSCIPTPYLHSQFQPDPLVRKGPSSLLTARHPLDEPNIQSTIRLCTVIKLDNKALIFYADLVADLDLAPGLKQ